MPNVFAFQMRFGGAWQQAKAATRTHTSIRKHVILVRVCVKV